jgi:DNA modification methylase
MKGFFNEDSLKVAKQKLRRPDKVSEPEFQLPKLKIKPYWQSKRAVLYCADCMKILPMIEMAEVVDAIVTDPPYDIVAKGAGIGGRRKYLADIVDFTDCGFDPSIIASFPNWMVFCAAKQLPGMFAHVGKRRWMILTWNKPNPTPLCNGNYLPDTEYVFHCFKSGQLFGEYADKSRFIVYPAQQGLDHPNEKPLTVMMKCVRNASDVGHTILDPFAGSCTTGVAAIRTGRKCILIEKEEKYCEIGARRMELASKESDL